MVTRRWDVIARLAKREGFTLGAEIGVADGRFTQGILSAAPDLFLVAVDYWPEGYQTWDGLAWTKEFQDGNRAKYLDVMAENLGRVRLIERPSVEAVEEVDDGSLDFVFIDADHSYEAVKADICAWEPKVRAGGFITGHDYDRVRFPSVIRAVQEFFPDVKTQEDYVWITRKT